MTAAGGESLLDRLLMPGALETLVQPILSVEAQTARLHSFECLTRGPAGTNLRRADVLFDYVRRKGAEVRVDRACVRSALAATASMPGAPAIAINIHASSLAADSRFASFLLLACEEHRVPLSRLTLEITEHATATDGVAFLTTLETLRALGVRIALDDIGIGVSNYKMMLDVAPDLFKIDAYVVHGCSRDPRRLVIIETLLQLASRLGGSVVVEGVEDAEDLDAALRAGVTLVQGFLVGVPAPAADYAGFTERSLDAITI
jgi:EAL domain-containing protein (putative c-di-GMP-specific phosphodiesterase class I)